MEQYKNLPARIWALLKSKKLALLVIAGVTLAVTLEMVVLLTRWDPSKNISEQTGFIYRSLWFQGLSLILLINLLACTVDGAIRRFKSPQGINRWGSSLFHIGLILIIFGCLMTGGYKTIGSMYLVEGEIKHDEKKDYQTIIEGRLFRDTSYRNFAISLQNQDVDYSSPGLTGRFTSLIELQEEGRSTTHRVKKDDQFDYKDRYVIIRDQSYALRLKLEVPDKVTREVTIPLESREWNNGVMTFGLEDFQIRPLPHFITAELYTDLPKNKQSSLNVPLSLKNPALKLTVTTNKSDIYHKLLRPGESIDIKGSRLTFLWVKPCTHIHIVYDPGAKVVFTGIGVALLGLALYYSVAPTRVRGNSHNRRIPA